MCTLKSVATMKCRFRRTGGRTGLAGERQEKASKEHSSGELQTLNFKVPADFKKQYKGYAVAQGMSMLELLKEGFALSKERRGS